MPQPTPCPTCDAPLAPARRDRLVERPSGYTLVRHVAVHVCPKCGEAQPVSAEGAKRGAALSGRRQLWSAWVSSEARPDFRPRPGVPFLVLQPSEPPLLTWTAGKVGALVPVFVYLILSLLSANDSRMLRVSAYAAAAFALIWFSAELSVKLNMPKWTGTAMGWFLLAFPVVVLSLYAVV